MNTQTPEAGDPIEQLRTAFRADAAEEVRRLLERLPDLKARINEPIGPFDSPTIVNAKSPGMIDVLLDAGADLNARSRWWAGGFGLLDSASPELAAYAISKGAVVDIHAAARLGMMDRLRELIGLDPESVHAPGGDGQTPLHFAATVDVAAFLLDHGAKIDAKDVDHESTPAQYMMQNRQDVARYLISRGCQTDLLMAAAIGDLDLVRHHLDADPACIRTQVTGEWFPMMNRRAGGTIYNWTLGFYASAHQVARKFGHEDVLQLLLDRSPAPVKLIASCWLGDEAPMQRTRAEHPDFLDSLTESDRQQVAHAARNNETKVVRLLLEAGLPANATSQHRASPLHWAAFHGNLEMTQVLLRHHPNLEATDADYHSTPLGWAIHGSENGWHAKDGDHADTVEALLQAGAKRLSTIDGSPAVQEVLRRG